MKICADCKHCKIVQINRDEEVYYCHNPKLGRDVVTGNIMVRRARDVRVGSSLESRCGMDGKWFESKESIISKWWSLSNKKALEK